MDFARRWLSRCGPLIVVLGLTGAASAAQPTSLADAGSYCGIKVPPDTDCANVSGGSWSNGYFNYNYVYHPGGGGLAVCAHTYIRSTSETVARQCDPNSAANNYEELGPYYNEGIELSGHAGNDSSTTITVDAETYVAG